MKFEKWQWDEKFLTGQANVDEQHNMLFEIINKLISVHNLENQNKESVENALSELVKYVLYHFTEEEGVMKKNNYPDLQLHQDQHYEFESTILSFGIRFKNGDDVTADLLQYMNGWLVEHILVMDMAAMKYCN
jgi:hemerythrin